MCIYELPDQICLTLWNAHRGFIYTALEKYAGGNGDMEVHTAHIRHQFQVGADLHTGEKCNRIKLQNLSPLSSATVKSWLNIQNALFPPSKFEENSQVSDNQQKWVLPVGQSEKLRCSPNHDPEKWISWQQLLCPLFAVSKQSLMIATKSINAAETNLTQLYQTQPNFQGILVCFLWLAQKNIHIVCLHNSTSAGQTEELKFSTNNNRGLLHVYYFFGLVWFCLVCKIILFGFDFKTFTCFNVGQSHELWRN